MGAERIFIFLRSWTPESVVVVHPGLPVLMIALCLKHLLRWLFALEARFQKLGKFNMAFSDGYC